MTKQEKINLLVADDIISIKESMVHEDYDYLYHVLTGLFFTPYPKLSKTQLEDEFNERLDNIKGNFKVLSLAEKINEKPIKLEV